MPIYEYKCEDCDQYVDQQRAVDRRDDAMTCPHCGGILWRQLAAPMGRVQGGTPKSNDTYNYADRFTSDVTGMPMDEVAGSGLHTPLPKRG